MAKKVKKELAEKTERKSATAVVKHLRISPRKMRVVIDAVRYKPATIAFQMLDATPRKAAKLTAKLLKSAVANAKDLGLEEGKLFISEIKADGGASLKRFRPRSMGRADRILKRTSHLSLVVTEGNKNWLKSETAEDLEAVTDVKGAKKPKASKVKKAGAKKKASAK